MLVRARRGGQAAVGEQKATLYEHVATVQSLPLFLGGPKASVRPRERVEEEEERLCSCARSFWSRSRPSRCSSERCWVSPQPLSRCWTERGACALVRPSPPHSCSRRPRASLAPLAPSPHSLSTSRLAAMAEPPKDQALSPLNLAVGAAVSLFESASLRPPHLGLLHQRARPADLGPPFLLAVTTLGQPLEGAPALLERGSRSAWSS